MASGIPPRNGTSSHSGQEFPGGAPAPASDTYESVNLFGRLTGHRITAQQGEKLPSLPRGFTWVRVGTKKS